MMREKDPKCKNGQVVKKGKCVNPTCENGQVFANGSCSDPTCTCGFEFREEKCQQPICTGGKYVNWIDKQHSIPFLQRRGPT